MVVSFVSLTGVVVFDGVVQRRSAGLEISGVEIDRESLHLLQDGDVGAQSRQNRARVALEILN